MGRRGRYKAIVLLLPALLYYLVFFLFPALQALWVSLHDWSGFSPQMEFIAFQNFVELSRDEVFRIALKNTLIITVVGGAATLALAFLFVYLLNVGIRGRSFFRAVIFLPAIVPSVGLGILWTLFFNPAFGMLNSILKDVGLKSLTRTWLGPDLALPSVIVVMVWAYVGLYTIILQAGVEKIPKDFADAARVDGASDAQIFLHVTLPMLRDVIAVAAGLWIVNALKTFELIMVMTEGGPGNATNTIAIYLYTMAFGRRNPVFRMGYATAMGVVLLVLVVVGVVLSRRMVSRERVEY